MNLDADGGPASRRRRAEHRVSAVQLGFDPDADRGDAVASQPAGEFRAVDAQLFRRLERRGPPGGSTIVSWLPFYHDMGLVLGICAPILSGYRAELTSPVAFLERPARWMRALAENHVHLSVGTQLRLRHGRPQNQRQRLGRARPQRGARHHQRRRTCRAGYAATLRRSVRALQFSRPHDASFVRLGRGNRLRRHRHVE